MSTRKNSLFLSLFGLFAVACGPENDPEPMTQPKVPVQSTNGYYQLTVEPAEGAEPKPWPGCSLGATKFKANIQPGPDPAPVDPWVTDRLPAEPPYTVKVNAPLSKLAVDRAPFELAIECAPEGIFEVEVEISNDDGVADTVVLRFEVK